jgi:hypothetical protein
MSNEQGARFGLNVQRFTISRAAGEEIRRIEKFEGHAAATQRLLQILFKKPNT